MADANEYGVGGWEMLRSTELPERTINRFDFVEVEGRQYQIVGSVDDLSEVECRDVALYGMLARGDLRRAEFIKQEAQTQYWVVRDESEPEEDFDFDGPWFGNCRECGHYLSPIEAEDGICYDCEH